MKRIHHIGVYLKRFLRMGWLVQLVRRPLVLFTVLCFLLALVSAVLSQMTGPDYNNAQRQAARLERKIARLTADLDNFAERALSAPAGEWLKLDDLPEDMVVYRYCADTIQSWVNQFPINNDEVDVLPYWYRLQYNTRNYFSTPLAFLSDKFQYVNLGSAWYVVRVYIRDDMKVIAGLLIKTEYLSDNAILRSRMNPRLSSGGVNVMPVTYGDGAPVSTKSGELLFNVESNMAPSMSQGNIILLWLSLLMALAGFYLLAVWKRSLKYFLISVAGALAVSIAGLAIGFLLRFDSTIFSPNLYADYFPFSSLGNLLIINLFVYFLANGIYIIRKKIIPNRRGRHWKIKAAAFLVVPVMLALYIGWTLNSLIDNSNITLEIFNVAGLDQYTLLCYVSYAMLFVALMLLLQVFLRLAGFPLARTVTSWKWLAVYVFLVSLYMVLIVNIKSYYREISRTEVWLNKLSVERDVSLELQLRNMESKIPLDPVINKLLNGPLSTDVISMITKRLDEHYFSNVERKYEIAVTVSTSDEQLFYQGGRSLVNINDYYRDQLERYGLPVSDKRIFHYLNNYNGRVSYLGAYSVLTENGRARLYIDMNSRLTKENEAYSALLFDYTTADKVNMPLEYSYAKYVEGKLTVYSGDFKYRSIVDNHAFPEGYSTFVKDGYRQFIYKISDDVVIMISRLRHNLLQYLISFSYLLMFNAAVFQLMLYLRRVKRIRGYRSSPRGSIKKKISNLVSISLGITLLFMGLGSIWLFLTYSNTANKMQMEEKLVTAQSTLTDFSKYIDTYKNVNSQDLNQNMDRLAQNLQADINLFDPHGSLIRSTRIELFKRFLLSSRMDNKAFHDIVFNNERVVIQKEKIENLTYYSMYAPLYNINGSLVAIVNIPYFARTMAFRNAISGIVATIVNLFILLLILALVSSRFLSRSLVRPISLIGDRMRVTDISKGAEHISYNRHDELGALVHSYNQMVDYIEASTKRLATAEREKAWNEMARQIAHEIKNPLTPIRLNIQYLLMLKQKGISSWEEKFEQSADSILEQIDNLANIASEFSSFTKSYSETPQVVDLYDLILNQKNLFDTRDDIKVLFTAYSDNMNAAVYVRRGNIVRVLVNLLSNAIQALESNEKDSSQHAMGFVRIALEQEGNFFIVKVEDNGPGVLPENVERLFNPKFTTKTSGTGLGLAICRNIVQQEGGSISYSPSELGGACFSFSIPVYNEI